MFWGVGFSRTYRASNSKVQVARYLRELVNQTSPWSDHYAPWNAFLCPWRMRSIYPWYRIVYMFQAMHSHWSMWLGSLVAVYPLSVLPIRISITNHPSVSYLIRSYWWAGMRIEVYVSQTMTDKRSHISCMWRTNSGYRVFLLVQQTMAHFWPPLRTNWWTIGVNTGTWDQWWRDRWYKRIEGKLGKLLVYNSHEPHQFKLLLFWSP